VGNDIPGAKKAIVGLTQIKGIGYNFATAILDTLKINTNTNIGFLSESDVQSIEKEIFQSGFLIEEKILRQEQICIY